MQRSRIFVVTSALITLLLVSISYLLLSWWLPNQKMTDPNWWQNASKAEIRNTSHQILGFPVGNHHDAFLALATTGNAQSVAVLISSLKWHSSTEDDFTLCTTEHVYEALRSLTGQQFASKAKVWQDWWAATGSTLSASEFYPRKSKLSKADSQQKPLPESHNINQLPSR